MKLLVSDYDGTYRAKEEHIEINNKAIEKFIQKGNLFMLSSGRPLDSLKRQTEKNNIPYTHLGTSDGNFLFDKDGNMLMANIMKQDIIDKLDEIKSLNIYERIQYAYPEENTTYYADRKDIGSIAFVLNRGNITDRFLKLYDQLSKANPDYRFEVYGYNSAYYYMIKPLGIDKSTPIRFLKKKLNLNKKKIFTIGDNINDIEMIRDYNGYMIGSNIILESVALGKYDAVYKLVDDINKKKVLKRW